MPVHMWGPELWAEFGPEHSEVLLGAAPAPGAEQQQGLLGGGHLWMTKVEGWQGYTDPDQFVWFPGAQ